MTKYGESLGQRVFKFHDQKLQQLPMERDMQQGSFHQQRGPIIALLGEVRSAQRVRPLHFCITRFL